MSPNIRVFEITQPIGMFATLTYCALLAKACEEKGLEPYIIASSDYYRARNRGSDWLSYFFVHRRLQLSSAEVAALRRDNRVRLITARSDINLFARGSESSEISNDLCKFSEAKRLFDKFFRARPEVLDAVDAFVQGRFDRDGQLGVHFRGRDHRHESERVDYPAMIEAALANFPEYSSIFMATDESKFLKFVRERMPSKNIATFSDPAKNNHRTRRRDNYVKGFNALCDCLLLSRCTALLKTPSALSTWSKVFGGDLALVLVGTPFVNPYKRAQPWYNLGGPGYFPESLLYDPDPQSMQENRVLRILPGTSSSRSGGRWWTRLFSGSKARDYSGASSAKFGG
jgi:hypothetical protein